MPPHYTIDVASESLKVAIEVDGKSHGAKSRQAQDARKDAFLKGLGVDSVEILEPTSDGTFGGLCPDGYVYNLHVEEDNTYWANGILVHNCHHAPAPINKLIIQHFLDGNPNLKVVGLTATPKRASGEALGQVFESVAIQRDIRWGVDEGWLVEPRQRMVHCGAIDFSHIRTTAGDLNSADLAAVMEAEEPSQKVKQATLEAMFGLDENELLQHPPETWGEVLMARGDPKRTIVFTVTVKQAEQLCSIMNRVIPGIVNFVHGKTPDYERDHMLAAFKSGELPCMINCDVLTEGYDNPFVELVVIAKPTKSLAKYIQFIGRETRVLPGIIDGLETAVERIRAILNSAKPFATVLDFHGNAGRHKIKTLLDVLGGLMEDDLRAKVGRTGSRRRKLPCKSRKSWLRRSRGVVARSGATTAGERGGAGKIAGQGSILQHGSQSVRRL